MSGSSPDIHGGRRVGKYETLTLLSMGGMAELYLAYTAGPGGFRKYVALKQILPDIKKDESFRKMFLDEARITAAFSHANIGLVFDLGEEDGELYLAMEFISGQNLEQVVKICRKQGREIPIGLAAMAVRDSCLALHYAHHFVDPSGQSAPVIHRDVSPKNVMVTYDGNVKVIDFGIAKAKGRLNRTQAGMVKGTSGYMSPEQVRNEPLDGRSDLFSAAVMLHEFLTGRRLFDGPSDAVTMVAIAEGEIPSPRSLNPKVPAALDAVVMKALSRDRAERYATGKEMAKAIDAALGGEIADEDDAAAFMQEVFAEKVKKTRALLEMAGRDDRNLSAAADQLREEAEPSARSTPGGRPPPRSKEGPRAGKTPRTPEPRPSQRMSAQRRPEEEGSRTPPGRAAKTPSGRRPPPPAHPAPNPKDRWASTVAADYALYSDQDEETIGRNTQPAGARPAQGGAQATSVRPALAEKEPGGRRWYSASLFWLLLLALVGGLGFAATRLEGGLGTALQPQYDKLSAWVARELAGEPPPPPPTPLARPKEGPPPGFAPPDAPAAPQTAQAVEAPDAGTPLAQAPGGSVTPAAAAEPRVEKAASRTEAASRPKSNSRTGGGRGSKKTTEKGAAAATALPDTTATQASEEVEVLDTRSARSAEKDGVGWLTLYTVPPAWVFDGATRLGTTPLIKMPLPSGSYRLRLMDPESKYRTLFAPVKPGKVTELKIRIADLPLDAVQD